MDLISLFVSAIVGLLGGAVSGVLAARSIGERTAAGERRYAAKTTIRGTVGQYKDELQKERERLETNRERSLEEGIKQTTKKGSAPHRETLAVSVLRELMHLRGCRGRRIRAFLVELVGEDLVNAIEATPSLYKTEVANGDLIMSELRRMTSEPHCSSEHAQKFDGTLSRWHESDGEDQNSFQRSIKLLSEILNKVRPV